LDRWVVGEKEKDLTDILRAAEFVRGQKFVDRGPGQDGFVGMNHKDITACVRATLKLFRILASDEFRQAVQKRLPRPIGQTIRAHLDGANLVFTYEFGYLNGDSLGFRGKSFAIRRIVPCSAALIMKEEERIVTSQRFGKKADNTRFLQILVMIVEGGGISALLLCDGLQRIVEASADLRLFLGSGLFFGQR